MKTLDEELSKEIYKQIGEDLLTKMREFINLQKAEKTPE